jgi:hypothetical protein
MPIARIALSDLLAAVRYEVLEVPVNRLAVLGAEDLTEQDDGLVGHDATSGTFPRWQSHR